MDKPRAGHRLDHLPPPARPYLGITSIYLQGIDNSEITNTVVALPAPTLPASAGLR
jgi:hypothetical protein